MAKLVFHSGPYKGKSIGLPQGRTIVMGRNRDLDLPLPDLKLSRRHCQVAFKDDKYTLTDLNSTNGTFVNGERIAGAVELNDFDRIVVGDIEIEFHYAEKVPLPMNFDAASADPFGLDVEEVEVPLEELKLLDEPAGAAPAAAMPAAVAPPAEAAPSAPVVIESPPLPEAQPPEPIAAAAPAAEALVVLPKAQPPAPQAPPEPTLILAAPIPKDALEAALRELDLPLPPEPPPHSFQEQAASSKPKLMFCGACEGSIPMLDYDLGIARVVDGHLLCKECLAKGARPLSQAEAPPTVTVKPEDGKRKSVSDILKALDEDAVLIDTSTPRRTKRVEPDNAAAKGPREVDKPKPKAIPKDVAEELGEEFEEIR